MDFRIKESKSAPPQDLPRITEEPARKSSVDNLPSFDEEEIHLPKFVEQEPQKKEEKKYQAEISKEPPRKGKGFLLLLVIIVILALTYFGYRFWRTGFSFSFLKKQEASKETPTETSQADFESQDDDGDELTNLQELQYGTNAKEKDTDFDGLPDGWEVKYKLNPLDYIDALADSDEDKLNNLEEYQYGSDPTKKDSDGDGYDDGSEVEHGYNPAGRGKLMPK